MPTAITMMAGKGVLSLFAIGLSVCLLDACHAALPSADLEPWLIKTRRDLHRIPELGFEEFLTSKYISQALDAMNITYK